MSIGETNIKLYQNKPYFKLNRGICIGITYKYINISIIYCIYK